MQLRTVCGQTAAVLGLNGLTGMPTMDMCLYSKMKHAQKLPLESGLPAVGQPMSMPVSPSGWQMEAAVGTLCASHGHPAAFTARLCLEAALSTRSATMGAGAG